MIRRATSDDTTPVVDLLVDCWLAAYRDVLPRFYLGGIDRSQWSERIRVSIETSPEETYVGDLDSEVVGLATVGECRDPDTDPGDTGEIWGLYVSPHHWRQGFGAQLLGHGEQVLVRRGYSEVTAWVFQGNAAGRGFYESAGFRLDGGSRTFGSSHDIPIVRYRKLLQSASQGYHGTSEPGPPPRPRRPD
jgi:ribosomal protein S18 acetylase RimI-like enzyme